MNSANTQIGYHYLDEISILPFSLYDDNNVLLCRKGEIFASKLSTQLQNFNLYCDKKEFETYLEKKEARKNLNRDQKKFTKVVKDIAARSTKNIIEKIRNGETVNVEECKSISDQLVEEVKKNYYMVDSPEQLCVWGNYNYTHPVNVVNLSTALGIKLSLNDEQLQDLGLAALLHDIGKSRFPELLLKKSHQELIEKEKTIYNLHPIIGFRIAIEELGVDKNIAEVILQHHEKHNGTGSPKGLIEDQIHYYSYIVSIASHYDNLTTGKYDGVINTARGALKIMLSEGSSVFYPRVLYTFIYMFNYNLSKIIVSPEETLKLVS